MHPSGNTGCIIPSLTQKEKWNDAGRLFLKLILSVDALSPSLSGIGRYTWELAKRVGQTPGIDQVRYYRNRSWVDDPAIFLNQANPVRRRRLKLPRLVRDWYWQRACHGEVFHAPNYFLPPHADNGVATVHDLSAFKFPEMHPVERIKQFEKLFRQTLDIAAHLITDSRATRQEVIDFFGWPAERITAIPLGVSPRFAPRSAAELAPTLQHFKLNAGGYSLCVSTIEPRKRIDNLLAAYARLPKKVLAAYPLVLAGGKGWRSEHLHEAIDAGQNAGWLRYLGFVAEEDLPALYAGAKLFVYPSIYEGFGLPVIEAMASGVPVISSDRSCLPEVAAGAAKLVNPDDLEIFTSTIEEALADVEWRQQAVANGLHVASQYNWAECVNRTVNVYKTQI